MKKYRCLITGGAGFIGSTIADMLLSEGHCVTILDNLSTGEISNINPQAKFYMCDIDLDPQKQINSYFENVNYVFHCAALPNVQYSIDHPKESNDTNVNTTIKTLIACLENKVNKIIYSGSCSVYGNAENIPTRETDKIIPLSPYALQKYIGEQYCELYHKIYHMPYVILRYFNVYGERMSDKGAYVSVLSRFIKCYENNQPLNITNNGEQKRDFVYVKDVVKANYLAMLNDKCNSQIINIGSGINHSINSIADAFNKPKKYGEKRIEPLETLADINNARLILNWYPETDVIDWIKQNLIH
jgi:UDP-glucose 4-epimerase